MEDRRSHVPFDPYFFEKRARVGDRYSLRETFAYIYATRFWHGAASVSGEGASLDQTRRIRHELPRLLEALGVDMMLDLPCGDFGWMQFVDLSLKMYIGADIVPELIAGNRTRYGDDRHRFLVLDVTRSALPRADLVLCRDCFVHLSFHDIRKALHNIRRSGITYLLTTTFPACHENQDITTGDWRVLNLEASPFDFPAPLRLINEACTEGGGQFQDKSLGLWRLDDLF
jgi:hypothetical protein